jgi:hypothetical protein
MRKAPCALPVVDLSAYLKVIVGRAAQFVSPG